MFEGWVEFAVGAAAGATLLGVAFLVLRSRYVDVDPAFALVLETPRGRRVAFRPRLVGPSTEARRVPIHPHRFQIELSGADAVWTRDRARVDVIANVTLRIARSDEAVLRAVEWLGLEGAADPKVLADLFVPHFQEAVHVVASTFTGEEVYSRRLDFRNRIVELVSPSLRDFVIDDLAISTFQKIEL